jgi:putative nucleotide binding protein
MTDPRRKRSIKTPSGPRKKDAPDPSQFKMAPPPMGRSEVPKPAPKPDPSSTANAAQRRGGRDGQRNNRNSPPNQRGGRGGAQGRRDQTRRERPEELKGENWARVVEHDMKDGVVTAITEKGLKCCRLKVKGNDLLTLNHRLYIGTDTSRRVEVTAILGMAHLDKMSNMARQDLPVAIQRFVEEHAQYFVDEFYNKAGPMSLKQHSYELLPDVGPVKARNMVKAREQVGVFASMDELNALAKINGAELLAQRFVEEIEDRNVNPRLIDLLLPVTA